MNQQLADILADYAEPDRVEVIATYPDADVRIIRYRGFRTGGGQFDVWIGDERIHAGVNTDWSAHWLAGNYTPAARPTP